MERLPSSPSPVRRLLPTASLPPVSLSLASLSTYIPTWEEHTAPSTPDPRRDERTRFHVETHALALAHTFYLGSFISTPYIDTHRRPPAEPKECPGGHSHRPDVKTSPPLRTVARLSPPALLFSLLREAAAAGSRFFSPSRCPRGQVSRFNRSIRQSINQSNPPPPPRPHYPTRATHPPTFDTTSTGPRTRTPPPRIRESPPPIGAPPFAMDAGYLSQQISTIVSQLHDLFDEIGVPNHDRETREEEVRPATWVAAHTPPCNLQARAARHPAQTAG